MLYVSMLAEALFNLYSNLRSYRWFYFFAECIDAYYYFFLC